MIHQPWSYERGSLQGAALVLALSAASCGPDAPRIVDAWLDEQVEERPVRAEARIDAGTSLPPADASVSGDVGRGAASDPVARAPHASAADAGVGSGDADLEALRQHCVDEINRYRATLGLASLARASDREACSDHGARLDGESMRAHGSATAGGRQGKDGYCPSSAQNTCPGWSVGGRSGNPTVSAALRGCLKMMWDEGPPPAGSCTGACYQAHGHYLNMSAPGAKRVACGFYKMKSGSYWMNQNFW